MKKYRWLVYIFLGVGSLMLVGAMLAWNSTRGFIAHAQTTTGKVVELREVRDKDGGSSTWKPVVHFTAAGGQDVTFSSSFSSNPAPYDVGDTVEVLYLRDDPGDARIRGFGSLWFGATLLAVMGLVFAAIGAGFLLASRQGDRKKKYLMAYGNAIETDFQGVDRNTAIKMNGRSPWRITSQWLDPATRKLRVFQSENLWFDPTNFVTTKKLTVLLDPKDTKRYYMDVSFLPEVEGS